MPKQIYALITILIVSSSVAYGASTVSGSVLLNFNVTPDNVSYGYSGGYFGNIDGVQAFFDDDYSTTLQSGASSIYATWDPVTGKPPNTG